MEIELQLHQNVDFTHLTRYSSFLHADFLIRRLSYPQAFLSAGLFTHLPVYPPACLPAGLFTRRLSCRTAFVPDGASMVFFPMVVIQELGHVHGTEHREDHRLDRP